MNKKAFISQLLTRLEHDLNTLTESAKAAYEGATHAESVAENEYDTRGLESSYLAAAQAKRAMEVKQLITFYRTTALPEYDDDDPVGIGALVELEAEGERLVYFLGPVGGGLKAECEGTTVWVITPQSPLGEGLLEREVGDVVKLSTTNGQREVEIVSIR